MTTYPLGEFPLTPSTEKLTLLPKQGVTQSPFTGASQVINNFTQWQLEVTFPAVDRGSVDEREMMAWLVSLRGVQGSFLYYPVDQGKLITGKTVFSTGYAESSSIVLTGWSGSAPSGLEAGDYFSLGNKLFCITQAPVNATAGNVTISFEPPLRANVNPGSVVNFSTPRVEMRLLGGDGGQGYSKDPEFTYFNPVAAVEAL